MDLKLALKTLDFEENDNITLSELKQRYRELAKDRHPDITGSGGEDFVTLQAAYVFLRKEVIKSKDGVDQQAQLSKDAPTSKSSDKSTQASTSTQITPENMLKTLSKDEILDRYLKDTKNLQSELETLKTKQVSQKTELNKVLKEVQKLQYEYQTKMSTLQNELQKEVDRLEGGTLKRIWQNFIVNPLTGRSDYEAYQRYVDQYNSQRKSLQFDFNDRLVNIYGRTLNQMNQFYEEIAEEKE
jgi:hypothetical protein